MFIDLGPFHTKFERLKPSIEFFDYYTKSLPHHLGNLLYILSQPWYTQYAMFLGVYQQKYEVLTILLHRSNPNTNPMPVEQYITTKQELSYSMCTKYRVQMLCAEEQY